MTHSSRFYPGNRRLGLALILAPFLAHAAEDTGGFIEQQNEQTARPALSASEVAQFLPERGSFRFPAPYNTRGARITNGLDCGGQDCVNYAGYSYWRNINSHAGQDSLLVFVGLDRSRGGSGPSLFEYHKTERTVTPLGPIFGPDDPLSWDTGEGWYFSATRPDILYVNNGYQLMRANVRNGQREEVLDIRELAGSGYYIAQIHSSNDGNVHSATVRDGSSYAPLGCMAYTEDQDRYQFFPRRGSFDECQVDRSGEWLVIKENVDGNDGEDNRIINLASEDEHVLLDHQGAGGHSDLGHGTMVAADNWAGDANTWKRWDLSKPEQGGEVVYHNSDWGVQAPAHVSHTNSRGDLAPEQQYACGSSVSGSTSVHANEVICFTLDGSGETLVVAPVMTDTGASGGGSSYAQFPKGNLDVTGRYFFWTSNTGGSRLDAFLVEIPEAGSITPGTDSGTTDGGGGTTDGGGSTADTTNDSTTNDSSSDGDATGDSGTGEVVDGGGETATDAGTVEWSQVVNLSATGDSLLKNAGCDGCADAGAISSSQLSSGNGALSFMADDGTSLLFGGLASDATATSPDQIDFAIRLQAGIAEVRELGSYQADTRFQAGDQFSIRVDNGTVRYLRNGTAFHTSSTSADTSLRASFVLYDSGSSVSQVALAGASESDGTSGGGDSSAGDEGTTSDGSTTSPDTVPLDLTAGTEIPANGVVWQDARNLSVDVNRIEKTGGCNGCADAEATSLQQILEGDGQFTFVAATSYPLLFAGLSDDATGSGSGSIDYGLRLQQGIAEVRENGRYVADTTFQQGDSFRIALQNGRIFYAKNGKTFHSTKSTFSYPLQARTVMYSDGAALEETTLSAEQAPWITGMEATATAPGEVRIQWDTDIAAESLVEFGSSNEYGTFTEHRTSLQTEHSAILSGLVAGREYHFRLFNRDESGHIANSRDYRFTMPTL